ncbi:MAG: response regulator [Rhodospirillales bacterium]|nr:response regulator [Rhodospirillales bacterium]
MPRVLIVDDNESILAIAKQVAERIGFAAATLGNAAQFMTTFVRFKPDIVVLDVVMPDIDGIEIVRWLDDIDYTGRLIIMSGYGNFDRMAKALAEARGRMVVMSLPKPFRVAELEAALRGQVA